MRGVQVGFGDMALFALFICVWVPLLLVAAVVDHAVQLIKLP